MRNTISHYIDCSISEQRDLASEDNETVLCLDFRFMPHSKAYCLSLMWRTKYQPTDSWDSIVERLVVELPKIPDVQCTFARQDTRLHGRYAILLGIKDSDAAKTIDALRKYFEAFDFSVGIIASSLH